MVNASAVFTSECYQEETGAPNPEFPDIYAVRSVAHGHLGNGVSAREALAEFSARA
jgi:hypothetical protein